MGVVSKDGSDGSEGSEGKEGREGIVGGLNIHLVSPKTDYNTFDVLSEIQRPNVSPLNPISTFLL